MLEKFLYRKRVEHYPKEQQHQQKKYSSDKNPFEAAPHDELHGLARVCEPEEGCVRATRGKKRAVHTCHSQNHNVIFTDTFLSVQVLVLSSKGNSLKAPTLVGPVWDSCWAHLCLSQQVLPPFPFPPLFPKSFLLYPEKRTVINCNNKQK